MSLLATLALAASGATLPACSWDRPGVNPFMGDVVAAVDRYPDMPAQTRAKLKARMARRDYDEVVSITRDGITGKAQYGGDIRDMYFGAGNICKTVTRSKWTDAMQERGLVYCEDGQCILVPTVCRNVSRIKRLAPRPVTMAGATPASSTREAAPETELEMDPTGAGPLAGGAPGAGPTSFAQLANPTLDSGLPGNPGSLLPAISSPSGDGPVLGQPALPSLPPGVPRTVTQIPTGPNLPGTPTGPTTPLPGVPEPSTWAMLLSGVVVLAVTARRRRGAARG